MIAITDRGGNDLPVGPRARAHWSIRRRQWPAPESAPESSSLGFDVGPPFVAFLFSFHFLLLLLLFLFFFRATILDCFSFFVVALCDFVGPSMAPARGAWPPASVCAVGLVIDFINVSLGHGDVMARAGAISVFINQ